jgi:hypothetical protein
MSDVRGKARRRRTPVIVAGLSCLAVVLAVGVFGVVATACRPGGRLAGSEYAHAVSLVVNLGRATLDAGPGVERAKVRITEYNPEWREPIIIFDGRAFATIPHEYGENDFLIEYGGARICAFRHFRFSNWHVADYRFTCTSDGPSVVCGAEILEGPGPHKVQTDPAGCAKGAARWGPKMASGSDLDGRRRTCVSSSKGAANALRLECTGWNGWTPSWPTPRGKRT